MKNMIKPESSTRSSPAASGMAAKDLEIWAEISELRTEIQRNEAILEELKAQYDYTSYAVCSKRVGI
ncbi:hypothetical protein Bealeia2_01919 (plasmid) [Candidatus Bealeia paramacronuclearis]|uniref:hypothetical protein n=1 Tax=Candidatus Bealeia paramacronuclearis TaxID=1921001 RepID=UPI002B643A1B|nr:hypothetical protein [Candidatus Bealeia paramacronuclearis]